MVCLVASQHYFVSFFTHSFALLICPNGLSCYFAKLYHYCVFHYCHCFSKFQAVVEQTPPSLRKAPPTGQALKEAPRSPGARLALLKNIPPALANIPGINPEHLTEADLLLADPATHTHPLGSHSLLPIHPGFQKIYHYPAIYFTSQQILSFISKFFDSLTSKCFSYPRVKTLTTQL